MIEFTLTYQSEQDGSYAAVLFRKHRLPNGKIIVDPVSAACGLRSKREAKLALSNMGDWLTYRPFAELSNGR